VLGTYSALQLNDFVEELKSTEFAGERQWTQRLVITSVIVGFLRRVLHGV